MEWIEEKMRFSRIGCWQTEENVVVAVCLGVEDEGSTD